MLGRHALVACAVVAAGLVAGCGSSDDKGSGGGGSKALTISAWDTGGGPDPIDKAVAEFKQSHPGVRVTLKKTPYAQFDQSLRLQLSSGRAPDVARILLGYGESSAALSLADKGLLTELSDAPWVKEVPKSSAYTVAKDGKTYAFPASSTVVGTFYDPAAFAKQGVAVPKTFDELLGICKKVAGSGTVPIAMGAAGESGMPMFAAFALTASTVLAKDPDFGARRLAGAVTFAGTPEWRQALTQFQELQSAGCFDKKAIGVSQEVASQQVKSGKALMAISIDLTLPLFTGGDPKSTLKMFPFPGNRDAALVRVAAGPTAGLAVPAKARNPELAKEFVDFYAKNRIRFSKIDNSIPSVPGGGSEGTGVPAFAAALEPFVADGRTTTIADALWPNPEVRTQLATGLVKLLLGKTKPDDVLKSMDSAWTAETP